MFTKRFALITSALFLLGLAITGTVSASDGNAPAHSGKAAVEVAMDTPTATPTCLPSWSTVTSPTLELEETALFAVDAVATNDVWSVGISLTDTSGMRVVKRERMV